MRTLFSLLFHRSLSDFWVLFRNHQIGCYAQTELGHGSNVRALETTATFIPESKGGQNGGSFVINSPTLTSAKFWPGTLGRTANHAMVIARLIDGDGADRGIHNFLVQLRSMKDHKLLPGVKTGDIGPKIGYNVMDNGFATFENVLVPRRNMAMRFAKVDESGKYTKTNVSDAASKVAYITMMQVRSLIVMGSAKALAFGCTIAIRYSAVRKQGYGEDGSTELQVLDYKQQQHRLFPLLAASYCFFFTGRRLWNSLKAIEEKLLESKPVSKVRSHLFACQLVLDVLQEFSGSLTQKYYNFNQCRHKWLTFTRRHQR